jgi:staphylococcal nuclease domain-containing protein 1
MWYRARVAGPHQDKVIVQYVDFGSRDIVPKEKISPLPRGYETISPMARQAALAYLVPPADQDDFFDDFCAFFRQLVDDKKLTATIEWRDGPISHVSLADASTHINCAIVREGLARVTKKGRHTADKTLAMLIEAEEKARAARINLWRYGDDDDDEAR